MIHKLWRLVIRFIGLSAHDEGFWSSGPDDDIQVAVLVQEVPGWQYIYAAARPEQAFA